MAKSKLKTVDEILSSLETEKKAMTEELRDIVKKTIPDATEIVRRRRITYVLNNKDFLSIRTAQSHVDLLFLCGAKCASHLLKGSGTGRDLRHVEVRNISGFDESELVRLLKEAERIS